jgi:FOG: Ankyrin repeat
VKKLLIVCSVFFLASGFTKEEIASKIDENIVKEFKTELTQLQVRQVGPADIVEKVQNNDYEGVKAYLAKGGKPNMKWADNTLLMIAAKRGYNDICELLLSYYKPNMSIDETNKYGWTALMFAAGSNQGKTVDLLIKKGADKNHKTSSFLETVIGIAAINCANDALVALLDNGANIEQTSSYNYTPLMAAIDSYVVKDEVKILATVKLLNSRKANVNARAEEGETPLMIAAAKGYYNVVNFLLSKERLDQGDGKKIEINAEDAYGRTALQYAKDNAHPKTADLIKQRGGK